MAMLMSSVASAGSEDARDRKIPRQTLHRWLEAYRLGGLAGLVRKSRDDRGRRLLPTELEHVIERMGAGVYRNVFAPAIRRARDQARRTNRCVTAFGGAGNLPQD
jgi:hypothetical protein